MLCELNVGITMRSLIESQNNQMVDVVSDLLKLSSPISLLKSGQLEQAADDHASLYSWRLH